MQPLASSSRWPRPAIVPLIRAIRPCAIATSALKAGRRVPSTTVPPRITRSYSAMACLLLDQVARDRQLLDLRRPAAELHELRVARQALHLVLLHVAVAAQDVDRLERDLRRCLAAEELARADVRRAHADLPAGQEVREHEAPHVAEESVHA